jgi:uncharacterized protein (DUF1800 family)
MARMAWRGTAVLALLALTAPRAAQGAGAAEALAGQELVLHAVSRLTFGPRPGDVDRVGQRGLDAWIEAQLAAGPGPEDAVDARLAGLDTLSMTPVERLVAYPPPQLVLGLGRVLTTRLGLSEAEVARLFPEVERIERNVQSVEAGEDPGGMQSERERAQEALSGPGRMVVELAQAKLIRAIYSERQLHEVMTDFWFNHFNVFVGKNTVSWWTASYEYDAIRPHALGRFRDLLGAVARHPAMLLYLDNWLSSAPGVEFDRRDTDLLAARANREQGLPPGGVATLLLRERGMDTSRLERLLGRRDEALRAGRFRPPPGRDDPPVPQRDGLNENYARELLELHTLGVDGGYTQDDVLEVARCFTGWTLLPLQAGQGFAFVPELHDAGTRVVLGREIGGRGMEQGERVLDLLARHPATARFLSNKLARRFVLDDPPPALVERMAETFRETDGDIRSVLRVMFRSAEFRSRAAAGAKVKTPLEYVVSLLRATEADLLPLVPAEAGAMPRLGLVVALRQLGQPLYGAQPPTGYGDAAGDWVAAGALMSRFKLAVGLASDRVPGVEIALPATAASIETLDLHLQELGQRLLGRAPSPSTVASIGRQLDHPPDELRELGLPPGLARSPEVRGRLALAWLLAAPEFQRR